AKGLCACALPARIDRCRSWQQTSSVRGRTPRYRPAADFKRRAQWTSSERLFRHHRSMGRRERSRYRAVERCRSTRSLRTFVHSLRIPQDIPLLGPAPRRSALRENRSIASAEIDFLREGVFANAEADIIICDSPRTFLDISGLVASFVASLTNFRRCYEGERVKG